MKVLGNIIWLIFGGAETAIEYFLASVALMITIIGIPFGLQTLKIGMLCLWPFGSKVRPAAGQPSCLSTLMNLIWFFIGGIWIALTHVFFGILLYITIIGTPFGKQHMKMAHIALTPFGRQIVR
ncbi:MAG: YccF domain-containing protein [Phocaeicola sp.]|uniref:YccF domain-containing protein n=1 Tax=Phocaeicola sp. TaxID=2773926 RepID=UPI003F9FE0A2